MKDRYREWSGGGCAAVKVKPKNCRDILLIARQDKTAFQAIHNTLLAGIINCDEFEQCIVLHAGVPGTPLGSTSMPLGSEETEVGWVSSQELHQFQQDRNREFRQPGGPGIHTSVTMICDYYGTRSESARAFDNAAERVLQSYDGNLDEAPNVWSRRHMRDLIYHEKLLESGQLCNLSFKHDDFWSEERIEEHYRLCVEKGGCERGRMVGTKREEHHQLCVEGGGCKQGRMVGTKQDEHYQLCVDGGGCERGRMEEGSAKDAHYKKSVKGGASERGHMAEGSAKDAFVALCVAKGGIPMGPMAETELADHRAKTIEGLKKTSTLLFRLANGKKDQEHKWAVTSRYYTTTCLHTFTNGFDDPIKGIRAFEDYLVDSYESEDLTEDGKLALAETIKKRDKGDKRKARYDSKKKRAN